MTCLKGSSFELNSNGKIVGEYQVFATALRVGRARQSSSEPHPVRIVVRIHDQTRRQPHDGGVKRKRNQKGEIHHLERHGQSVWAGISMIWFKNCRGPPLIAFKFVITRLSRLYS